VPRIKRSNGEVVTRQACAQPANAAYANSLPHFSEGFLSVRPFRFPLLYTAVLAAGAVMGVQSHANAFEDPPVANAASLLGAQAKGPNYTVEPEVRGDGLNWSFQLRTRFGTFEVNGQDLLRQRIRELGALRRLQAMSESDVFMTSLGQAAAAPLRYGADLITDPTATLQKSASGVANMFNRIGAGLSGGHTNRDNVVGSVLGIDAARRALAVKLGVDPYTDFEPLAAKLQEVARASALGGLSMRALMMAIPGGAGVVVSSSSTADTVRSTLAEKTAAQIVEQVRGRLTRLGVPTTAVEGLVENRLYTPADLLLIANSLATLKARGNGAFIARAAEAASRDEAFFQRRRAELLAANAKALGIGDFVEIGGFPFNRLKDGRIIGLFPLDEVAWTENVARMANGVTTAARQAGYGAPVLALTGTVTDPAQEELAKLGWTVQRLR